MAIIEDREFQLEMAKTRTLSDWVNSLVAIVASVVIALGILFAGPFFSVGASVNETIVFLPNAGIMAIVGGLLFLFIVVFNVGYMRTRWNNLRSKFIEAPHPPAQANPETTNIEAPEVARANERIRAKLDSTFELCLLLVTVLAAAELQYTSFFYPLTGDPLSQQYLLNSEQVNVVFRVTTLSIIIMIIIWIVALLIPPSSLNLHGLRRFRRRFVKEFCWSLFGNLFVLEGIIFVYLAFSKEMLSSILAGEYGTLFAVLLTFPATWHYVMRDRPPNNVRPTRRQFEWRPILEHVTIYMLAYGLIQWVLIVSGTK